MDWEQARTMLEKLSNSASNEQTKLQELAGQQVQQGFRNPGQTGWEALTNPDAAQSKGMMDIALRMMGSDPRASFGQATQDSVSKGLSLMDTMKDRAHKQKLGAQQLAVQGADKNFSRAKDIMGMIPAAKANSVQEIDGRMVMIGPRGEVVKDLGPVTAKTAKPVEQVQYRHGGTGELRGFTKQPDGTLTSGPDNARTTAESLAKEGFSEFRGGSSNIEDKDLSSHLQRRLSASTDSAVASRTAAFELEDLGAKLRLENFEGGVSQNVREWWKTTTGSRDLQSSLRTRYQNFRIGKAIAQLPPGPASDKDIRLVLLGVPPDNSSSSDMADFVEALGRLEKASIDFYEFQANYVSENRTERGMLKAWDAFSETKQAEQRQVLVEATPPLALERLKQDPSILPDFITTYGYNPNE